VAAGPDHIDIAIAGGGLAGSLIAWRLKTLRPELRLRIFERGLSLGGDHTWSFHQTDLSPATQAWLDPLIVHRWDGQTVRFPNYTRTLNTGYRTVTSDRLSRVLTPVLGESVITGAEIAALEPDSIRLADGRAFRARAVIDCRGQRRSESLTIGFQKFVGQEVRLKQSHGLTRPIIMDATVPQEDGYRFVYVLPTGPREALIEDTRYADGHALNDDGLIAAIATYARDQGWEIETIVRTERGVLPIALSGDFAGFWAEGPDGVARAGMAAALFHPLTGYSLPYAAALAERIAAAPDLSGPALHQLTHDYAAHIWEATSFYRLLSRLLFRAAEPADRYRVMQRFYTLPQGLIERLYAGVSPMRDKARILVGKPPVPISRAIPCLFEDRPATAGL